MAGWHDIAICFDPSAVFALGWLGNHRLSDNNWAVGRVCWTNKVVGVTVSHIVAKHLHSQGKYFARHFVSYRIAVDHEFALVCRHYADALYVLDSE